MPTNYRCKYNNIFDSWTKRYRVCKNKKCSGDFCMLHYKLLYTKHAIVIQKIYKGYYIRKKLKIYYNLPRDLQRKIIWHINSDHYLRHYSSSVSKIIYNRYKEFNQLYYKSLFPNFDIPDTMYNSLINDLISLINISIKYYPIIKIYKIPYHSNFNYLCSVIIITNHYNNLNDNFLLILKKYNLLFN